MKQKFFKSIALATCVLMANVSAKAITVSKILLQHGDDVTMYNSDQMETAIDAASEGDIIYMTTGVFSGFTINKAVEIRGAGETTVISGNVSIAVSNGLSITKPLLDGVSISGAITMTQASPNLLIRKCKFNGISFNATVQDVMIDRCYCTGEMKLTNTKDANVVNSKIYTLYSSGTNSTITNCNVYIFRGGDSGFKGMIINSMLYRYYSYNSSYRTIESCVLMNSLINTSSLNYDDYDLEIASSCSCVNCWTGNFSNLIYTNCECTYSTAQLQSKGYLGTDGNVVGIYGGATPYTLTPSAPKVTDSNLEVDKANKKLNVTLKVSAK